MHDFRDYVTFVYTWIGEHKWVLACLPLVFIFFFFFSMSLPRQGVIKTATYQYVGMIASGVPNGEGTLTYTNGNTYTGNFKNGFFDSQGVFTSKKDQWTFSGQFIAGNPNGRGTLKTPDGVIHTVNFKNGALIK